MVCPNCRCVYADTSRRCPVCGAAPESVPQQPTPANPSKKGTHWIPLLIMAVLTVMGLSLFFALPYDADAAGNALQGNSDSDTPWFVLIDGELYFTEAFYDGPAELTVPETIGGETVTAIGEFCFAYNDTITTVILPDTIESIGTNAFAGCSGLRGIYIPEGVTYIGTDAFLDCTALEAVCIPGSVEYIEPGAFDGCHRLRYILYSGIHSHWNELYWDYIGTETQVYCTDGTFIQRQRIP